MIKSIIFASFCFAICYVLFLALRKDDLAAFKGLDEGRKFRPSKNVDRGTLFSASYRGEMAGDMARSGAKKKTNEKADDI